jgi:hypothetical protein
MDEKTIVVTRNGDGPVHDGPVIDEFLAFLEADMEANAGNVRPVPQELLTRARDLTDDLTVNLDGPLDPDDE